MTAMARGPGLGGVLVDLDGTLADTAPDMVAAANRLLVEEGASPLHFDDLRPLVSFGALGLVRRAFGADLEGEPLERLRRRFLELYAANLCAETRLFPEFEDVLDELEARGVPWGVVTNKPGWLTEPLLETLRLRTRAGSIVSGDTLPERKPHPAPLLRAAHEIGVAADDCVYVGDARRDIEAGRAAGMATIAAGWGYIPVADSVNDWAADLVADSPTQILQFLAPASG
jgi:2-phosphoglycolate phosphatase